VNADSPHFRQNWRKAARPLLEIERRKRMFVQTAGQEAASPFVVETGLSGFGRRSA